MNESKTPFHNPFGALKHLGGANPRPAPTTPAPTVATPSAGASKGPARAVVRIERAGRGGKDVTVIEHLNLSPAERDVWLKTLKTGLGCGGTIEGDAIVLQGDQRDRLPKLLTARGVKKVTRG